MVNDMMEFYLSRFGTEMAVRREEGTRCVRVVVGVVVMDDVVVGGWLSKIRRLSALWNVLCSSLHKVLLGNDTARALINKDLLCVLHRFDEFFRKR